MKNYKDYFIYGDGFSYPEYLEKIVGIIVDEYEALGCRFDDRTHRILPTDGSHPTFFPSDGRIVLSFRRCSLWCKVIYQTAHELTHLFMNSHLPDQNKHASWVEEIVCEAATLCFLHYFANNWRVYGSRVRRLSRCNPGYASAVTEYLEDALADYRADASRASAHLSDFTTYGELLRHNVAASEAREVHAAEVLRLYSVLSLRELAALIRYRDYLLPGKVLLDEDAYLAAYPCDSVRTLLSFQKKIVR